MNIELITKADIHSLKTELLEEIKKLFQSTGEQKEWLKSSEVKKLLKISPGTLQNLRVTGVLPYHKIGGTIFYSYSDVTNMINKNKVPGL